MITLWIQFDGLAYPIPVNPSELVVSQSATNNNIDIVGLGKATRKGEPDLRTLQIKSFFPSPVSRYYQNIPPIVYIDFLNKIWHTENINNKVAWLYSFGFNDSHMLAEPINMYFVIEKFDYKYKGGDFDTEYTLNIKEYKEYGVRVTNENFTEGMKSARIPSTVKQNVPGLMQDTNPTTENKTFTVPSGYSLWRIAKESTGNGSNWPALYELNKNIIGDDPNRLTVGIKLTLPENWNSPSATINTSTSRQVSMPKPQQPKILDNNTASNKVEETKEVEPEKTWAEEFTSDRANVELMNFSQRYKEQLNELDRLIQSIKDVKGFKLGVDRITRYDYNETTKKLQTAYNKALRINQDKTKSPEERMTAIRQQYLYEREIYNKYRSDLINYWSKITNVGGEGSAF